MRGFVFIDGSNFYFKLKQLSAGLGGTVLLLDFDFQRFARWLVAPDELCGVRYYIGAVKQDGSDKAKRLYADQQRLFRRLHGHGVEVVPGHLIRHPDRTFHEKGVDVRLAVEMIRLAREDRYDQAYLLSSDTDLVPAVEEVRSFGKRVQYVGIPKGQSYGLSKAADDVRLIRPDDIRPFFPTSEQ
jgi:uncharacterized LabA/DUF88 family protein